ncbi:MAG: hypothetical protein LKCHEGNO_01918 [Burkholderiaceae bacterium]|nr:hypothetical protein [Burkholderiaceae bacterium]
MRACGPSARSPLAATTSPSIVPSTRTRPPATCTSPLTVPSRGSWPPASQRLPPTTDCGPSSISPAARRAPRPTASSTATRPPAACSEPPIAAATRSDPPPARTLPATAASMTTSPPAANRLPSTGSRTTGVAPAMKTSRPIDACATLSSCAIAAPPSIRPSASNHRGAPFGQPAADSSRVRIGRMLQTAARTLGALRPRRTPRKSSRWCAPRCGAITLAHAAREAGVLV